MSGMVLGAKKFGGREGARKLAFFVSSGTSRQRATAGRLGTGHWTAYIGAHTGSNGKYADEIEAGINLGGVGADRPARIHTGTNSESRERAKGGDGAAYDSELKVVLNLPAV